MELEEIKKLIAKYNLGTASEEERRLVIEWYESIEGNEPDFAEGEFDGLKGEVRQMLDRYRTIEVPVVKRMALWQRIAGVAAAVAAITLGVWLYYSSGLFGDRHPDLSLLSRVTRDLNDIAPGKNMATLTLTNGETITLSDTKTGVVISNDLRYNDGTEVALLSPSGRDGVVREGSTNNNPLSPQGGPLPEGEKGRVQTLIATTPRGGTYQVTLPDGTHVWLNADTKISFPSQFSGKKRRILLLNGEAYFEVAKNKAKPFIVTTDKQTVEVLGTHFNINSYKDERAVRTTLLEGSVRIYNLPEPDVDYETLGDRMVILKPNQQAIITKRSGIAIKEVNVNDVVDWKNGEFVFKGEALESIMRKVSRWYDVEVTYAPGLPDNLVFGGYVSRSLNISAVLRLMERTGKVKFTVDGKKVYVSSNNTVTK